MKNKILLLGSVFLLASCGANNVNRNILKEVEYSSTGTVLLTSEFSYQNDNLLSIKQTSDVETSLYSCTYNSNKVNERRIIFNYTGLSEINLNNYNTNAYGVCKEKLYKGANYFNLGEKYWMLDFKFGRKENYYCWKVGGEVYDLNTNTKLRDTIGHVWWYKESHWYWFFNDEIWGFQEEGFQNGWQFYYAMFNC